MTDRPATQGGTVVEVAERFVRQADGQSAVVAARMAGQFAETVGLLDTELDLLERNIAARMADGSAVPVSWLHNQARYRSLLDQSAVVFEKYAANAYSQLDHATRDSVRLAQRAVQAELGAAYAPGRGIVGNFNKLPTSAIERLAGTLSEGSPVRGVLNALPRDASRALEKGLKEGLSLGLDPRSVVRRGRDAMLDEKWKSARIVRTEMFRAFREGNRAGFKANDHLVDGWIWHSAQGTRTCAACWAMHGQEFSLDEPMGSHPNCRCTQVPKTKSWEDLGFSGITDTRPKIVPGVDKFRNLSSIAQRQILGPGKYDDYARGLIDLPDVIRRVDDPIWATTRSGASRQAALDNAAKRTRPVETLTERVARVRAERAELPWNEQIALMRPTTPGDVMALTEDKVRQMGRLAREEIMRRRRTPEQRVAANTDLINDLQRQHDELLDQYNRKMADLTSQGMSLADRLVHPSIKRVEKKMDAIYDRQIEARRANGKLTYDFDPADNTYDREIVRDVLREVRPVGTAKGVKQPWAPRSNPEIKKLLDDQYQWYPDDWWNASRDYGPLFAQVPGKGTVTSGRATRGAYYWHKYGYNAEIVTYKGDASTAIHEMAHRMQSTVSNGKIRLLEHEFYDRRTANEPITHMGPGYDAVEMTRRDKFVHPYIGRYHDQYPDSRGAETLSMGLQSLFSEKRRADNDIYTDEDMLDFILGVLIGV